MNRSPHQRAHGGVSGRSGIRACVTLIAAVSVAGPVLAQDTTMLSAVGRFAGQLVYVEDRRGDETLARVVSATPDILTAQVGGVPRAFARKDIRRISMTGRDPVRNGFLIGAAAGALMGVFSCGGGTESCSVAGATLGSAALFGALGAWIDHRREGRVVIFRGAP